MYDPKAGSTWAARTVWRADPGEVNQLELRAEDAGRTIVLRDAGAPIRAGRGCAARADGTVACTSAFAMHGITAVAADGDDLVQADGVTLSADGGAGADRLLVTADDGQSSLRGGDGDDLLVGSDGPDVLDGGAGADVILGGDGADAITDDPPAGPYAADRVDAGAGGDFIWGLDRIAYARPTPVVVDLQAGFGGAPGEGDVLAGIEGLDGGSADDVLLGGDGPETIGGGPGGVDLIDGRGGNDSLAAADRRSRVIGGDGDDTFRGNGMLACGPGRDNVYGPLWTTLVEAAACERIVEPASFSARALTRRGRVLTLRLRGFFHLEPDRCGAVLTLRPGAGGAVLARRFVRLPEGRPRTARIVARRSLPPQLRVELRAAFCAGGRVRLKPAGGWDRIDGPTPPLRFSLVAVTPFG
jgi:hypothetical protein